MISTTNCSQPPFDSSAKSDVILRSSDNVDFYVLKFLLSFSSPYFESIFSQQSHIGEQHLPTIELREESKTLQAILPFFYPGIPPRVGNLDDIINVLAAGHKYGVDIVVKQMSQELLDLPIMTEDPFRMFALAFYHGWETVGRIATKNTLAISLSEVKLSSELAYISGTEMYKLLQYRLQCISAIRENREKTQRLLNDLVMPGLNQRLARPPPPHFDYYDYDRPSEIHKCSLPAKRPETYYLTSPGGIMIDGLSISGTFSIPPEPQWWWVIYIRDLLKEVQEALS